MKSLLKKKLLYLRAMESRFPIKEDNPHKYNRWLGFVQGALWIADLISLDELKHITKGKVKPEKAIYKFLKTIIKE